MLILIYIVTPILTYIPLLFNLYSYTSFNLLLQTAFPNSKLSPPKRGDSDFQVRSKKLNSAYDMIEDGLRSKIDLNWEQIHKHFHELDSDRSGFVSKDQFKVSRD